MNVHCQKLLVPQTVSFAFNDLPFPNCYVIIPVVIIEWNPVKFVAMLRSDSHDNLQQQNILCLTLGVKRLTR